MQELIKIGNQEISVKEFQGKRVVTFKDVDMVHERPEGTARKRFNDNKERFIEGEDYFKITPSEFRTAIGEMDIRQQNDVTLLTEQGYLMLVKSFTDDLAWKVQRELVNTYFAVKQFNNPFSHLSKEMQAILMHDEKIVKIDERLSHLENEMVIDHEQQQILKRYVNKVVVGFLGGKGSNAYKEISKKVFSECNRDFQNYFKVNSRNNTPKKRFDEAIQYIECWKPCTNTLLNIQDCNAQMSF